MLDFSNLSGISVEFRAKIGSIFINQNHNKTYILENNTASHRISISDFKHCLLVQTRRVLEGVLEGNSRKLELLKLKRPIYNSE